MFFFFNLWTNKQTDKNNSINNNKRMISINPKFTQYSMGDGTAFIAPIVAVSIKTTGAIRSKFEIKLFGLDVGPECKIESNTWTNLNMNL